MTHGDVILTLLVIGLRICRAGVGLVVDEFEFFIDEISASVLPLGVALFDTFDEYARTVLVVEVVLLKGKHLVIELFALVPPLEIFLHV